VISAIEGASPDSIQVIVKPVAGTEAAAAGTVMETAANEAGRKTVMNRREAEQRIVKVCETKDLGERETEKLRYNYMGVSKLAGEVEARNAALEFEPAPHMTERRNVFPVEQVRSCKQQ
jgi:hypothetical protein